MDSREPMAKTPHPKARRARQRPPTSQPAVSHRNTRQESPRSLRSLREINLRSRLHENRGDRGRPMNKESNNRTAPRKQAMAFSWCRRGWNGLTPPPLRVWLRQFPPSESRANSTLDVNPPVRIQLARKLLERDLRNHPQIVTIGHACARQSLRLIQRYLHRIPRIVVVISAAMNFDK